MKFRNLAIAGIILMLSATAIAQSSDPVSGVWGNPEDAGFELKFDGRRTVSGSIRIVNNAGKSKVPTTGTYDPMTRVLKLEADAARPDGSIARFSIEGMVSRDTVKGVYRVDGGEHEFSFARHR